MTQEPEMIGTVAITEGVVATPAPQVHVVVPIAPLPGASSVNYVVINGVTFRPETAAPFSSTNQQGLLEACKRILPYLNFTISKESPGWHPTMPSAVAAFKEAIDNSRDTASFWRNDAIEKAAQIAERYGADPWIARDIRALAASEVSL